MGTLKQVLDFTGICPNPARDRRIRYPVAEQESPIPPYRTVTSWRMLEQIPQERRLLYVFLDSDEEQMWTDDHEPPRPTSTWKEGETVQYARTVFVPIYPYVGQATVRMGLYDTATNTRLPLEGTDAGQRSYTVGTLELLPQSENVFLVFKDGWHPAESAADNPAIEWQWTKKVATLAFRNPKRDIWFYLHLDGRPDLVERPSQPVTVTVGSQPIDQFDLASGNAVIRKVAVSAAQLGSGDTVEVKIDTGASFVPALTPSAKSRDPRELGVRVFHAFVEPK